MSSDVSHSALKRLLERVVRVPDPKLLSPTKAMRNALPKAADHAMDLPLVVADIGLSEQPRDALLEQLKDGRLYMLIQNADERLGIAVPDPALLSGLIEIQTMGTVSDQPVDERLPTRTDASMVEPFIDALLAEFVHQLLGDEEQIKYVGFSYYRLIEDKRHLPLVMPEDEYTCYDLSMGLGRVAKPAKLLLAFPSKLSVEEAPVDVGPQQKWSRNLEAGVLASHVDINVVLHRFSMPLDEVSNLVVGQDIHIPRTVVNSLRVEGSDSKQVATGKLGQANGFRAVKFNMKPLDGSAPQESATNTISSNPLEAMGSMEGPIPVTQTAAVHSLGTGLPDDFADISPPDEDMTQGAMDAFASTDDLAPLGDLPAMGDLPQLDDFPAMGDLPDLDFPAASPIEIE